jgi:UPF0716 family protein affecting phage T7 exclusion
VFRGVQTWLIIGIPFAVAISAIYLRTETKSLYFLIARTGAHPSDAEAAVPNILCCAIIVGGYLFLPGFVPSIFHLLFAF